MLRTLSSYLLCAGLALVQLSANAQSSNSAEFEGVIKYKHTFKPITKGYNTKKDLAYFGPQSQVSYQQGNLRWDYNKAWLRSDIFRAADTVEYLFVTGSDTAYYARNNYSNEEIKEYHTIQDGGTVMGIKCKAFSITTVKNGHQWERRFYYAATTAIDPKQFRKYRINSMYVVYSAIQSLPLKIEYLFEDRKVTFTAIAVTPKKLDAGLFGWDPALPMKRL